MAKNGIVTTTQHAITDVARTGIEGARAIAGSAVDAAALAATGTVLKAVRGARKMVAVPKKRRSPKRRAAARRGAVTRRARKVKTTAKRRVALARKKVRRTASRVVRRKKR
jgi:hypothetical protein